MIRLDKLLSNLGYVSRSDVRYLIQDGVISSTCDQKLKADLKVDPTTILFNGEKLDLTESMVIMLNKPKGYVCSRNDSGDLVFELLPERLNRRSPPISIVGRLDKESQGLLLLTDDGKFLHKLTHPSSHVSKEYLVETAKPFRGDEESLFSSGTFSIEEDESHPLLPVGFKKTGEKSATMILHEGKNRQIRRMFEKLGNEVTFLQRVRIGALVLPEDLKEGEWRVIDRVQCLP